MYETLWYENLQKPFLTPPDGVFMPAWIILYAMIFISFILFLKSGNLSQKIIPISTFLTQLFLNLSWSPVFFGLHKIGTALIIIIFMWMFILITILLFYRYSKISAYLLVPYFLWVTFASYLNFEIYRLNPSV